MELLNYFTLGIAIAAFILAAINLYNINNLTKALDSALDAISSNNGSIAAVSDDLLDLRRNFSAGVLEALEELSGQKGNVFSSWIEEIADLDQSSEKFAKETEESLSTLHKQDVKNHEHLSKSIDSFICVTERRLFELENPLTEKAQFFDEDEGFDVIKTNSGFRFKRNGKSEDIDRDAFYDLWFAGEIRKADA